MEPAKKMRLRYASVVLPLGSAELLPQSLVIVSGTGRLHYEHMALLVTVIAARAVDRTAHREAPALALLTNV